MRFLGLSRPSLVTSNIHNKQSTEKQMSKEKLKANCEEQANTLRYDNTKYIVVPSPVLHPYYQYYTEIASATSSKIIKQGDFIRSVKLSRIIKAWLVVKAVILSFYGFFFYRFAKATLQENDFLLIEAVINERISWQKYGLLVVPRFDALYIKLCYNALCTRIKARRAFIQNSDKHIIAVFVMDVSYGSNAVFASIAKKYSKVCMLCDYDGLLVRKLKPTHRFFGDISSHDELGSDEDNKVDEWEQGNYTYMKVKLSCMDLETDLSSKKGLLVYYAHDFRDAYHFTFNSLFRDQAKLLFFLAKFAKKTGHQIAIKWHPNSCKDSKFMEEYLEPILAAKGLKFVDPRMALKSLKQIQNLVIMTGYGSIIFEAAKEGVPVIATSNYAGDFLNLATQPKTVEDLIKAIMNPPKTISRKMQILGRKILESRILTGNSLFPLEYSLTDSRFLSANKIADYASTKNSEIVQEVISQNKKEFTRLVDDIFAC